MLCFSVAHSPKSINWQRLLQKGLYSLLSSQATSAWQVGQLTDLVCLLSVKPISLFR